MAKSVKKKEAVLPPPDIKTPLQAIHAELVKLIPGAGTVDERQNLADRLAAIIETL